MIIVWVVFTYVALSFFEYVSHRWLMHAPRGLMFPEHAVLHHGHYFPRGRFVWRPGDDPAAPFISIGTGPMPLWTAPFTLLLFFCVSKQGAMVFFGASVLHGILWRLLHAEMHFARRGWLARSRLFRFWYDYHHVHHDEPRFNYASLLPMFDHVFGTYRAPMAYLTQAPGIKTSQGSPTPSG